MASHTIQTSMGNRRPRKNRGRKLPKVYESVDSILITEPRIEAIRRELQALLSVVDVEVDGQAVVSSSGLI